MLFFLVRQPHTIQTATFAEEYQEKIAPGALATQWTIFLLLFPSDIGGTKVTSSTVRGYE
jgi:hypothetical protein